MRQSFLVILSTVLLFVLMGISPQETFAKPDKDGWKSKDKDWRRGDRKRGGKDWRRGDRNRGDRDWRRGDRRHGDWNGKKWKGDKDNKFWKHKKYKRNKKRFQGVGYPGNGPMFGNSGIRGNSGNWNLKGVGHPGHGLVHPAHGISHPVHGIIPKDSGKGKGKGKGKGWRQGGW